MTIGILALAAFFALSLKHARMAYGLVLALLPAYLFRFQLWGIPSTALEAMIGVFLFAVLLTHYNKATWEKVRKLGAMNYAVMAFLLAAVLSVLVSPEPVKALGQLKAFFVEPVLMFYATVAIFKSKKDFDLPLKWLFGSVTLISLVGIAQNWTHILLPLRFWGYGVEVRRITSIFEYPNALALYLAPLFVLFLVLLAKNYGFMKRSWLAAGVITMFVALILTYSRGAWLAVIVGVVVFLALKRGVPHRKWIVAAVLALLLVSPLMFARLKGTFHDASSNERLSMYKVAVAKIIDQPFLGNGLYGFRKTLEQADYSGEILNYPHNIILNFWTETGLLGVLSFAFIIFLALQKYRSKTSVLGLAAALYLLAMFAHGMVDAPYFKNDLSVLFWAMISVFYLED
jgi:putative inorganic carbon (hco3(-)) transporter